MRFCKMLGFALTVLANFDGSYAMHMPVPAGNVESLKIVMCPLSRSMCRYAVNYEPASLKFNVGKFDNNATMLTQTDNNVSIVTSEMISARIGSVRMKFNIFKGSIQIQCSDADNINIEVSSPAKSIYKYSNELMSCFPVISLEAFHTHVNTVDVRNLTFAVTSGDSVIGNISVQNSPLLNVINYGDLEIGEISADCRKLQFFNNARLDNLKIKKINGNCKELVFNNETAKIQDMNLDFKKLSFEK